MRKDTKKYKKYLEAEIKKAKNKEQKQAHVRGFLWDYVCVYL